MKRAISLTPIKPAEEARLPPLSADRVLWWAYLHANGSVQLKRWLGDHRDYTDDCIGNEFIKSVVPPFSATSREMAWAFANDMSHHYPPSRNLIRRQKP